MLTSAADGIYTEDFGEGLYVSTAALFNPEVADVGRAAGKVSEVIAQWVGDLAPRGTQ
jgi:hypothetical protein